MPQVARLFVTILLVWGVVLSTTLGVEPGSDGFEKIFRYRRMSHDNYINALHVSKLFELNNMISKEAGTKSLVQLVGLSGVPSSNLVHLEHHLFGLGFLLTEWFHPKHLSSLLPTANITRHESLYVSIVRVPESNDLKPKCKTPEKVMFVAHPDDEILFGNLVNMEPSCWKVVSITGYGTSRHIQFARGMRLLNLGSYGVWDYRDCTTCVPFQMGSTEALEIRAKLYKELAEKPWKLVATHNPFGEYGHLQHVELSAVLSSLVPASMLAYFSPSMTTKEAGRELKNVQIMKMIYPQEVRRTVAFTTTTSVLVRKEDYNETAARAYCLELCLLDHFHICMEEGKSVEDLGPEKEQYHGIVPVKSIDSFIRLKDEGKATEAAVLFENEIAYHFLIDDVSKTVMVPKRVKRDVVQYLRNALLPAKRKQFAGLSELGSHCLIPLVRNGEQYFHTFSLQVWVTMDVSRGNAFIHNSIELHTFAEPVRSEYDIPTSQQRFKPESFQFYLQEHMGYLCNSDYSGVFNRVLDTVEGIVTSGPPIEYPDASEACASNSLPVLVSYEVSLDRQCKVYLISRESGGESRILPGHRPKRFHPDPEVSDQVLHDYLEILSSESMSAVSSKAKEIMYRKIVLY